MNEQNQTQIDYWFKSAAHDLDTAETLFQQKKYDWCLFIGHLVLEKLLKAFYIEKNNEIPPKTHNLLYLAEKTTLNFSEDEKKFLEKINAFNIEARYPDIKMKFYEMCTREFSEEYFLKIKDFYLCLLKKKK